MTKEERYKSLLPQVKALCEGEEDMIAKMANVAALLHTEFGFWWTGFYRVVNNELLLGPFQGPIACVHIAYGRGVCGTAWKERRTIVVPDVEEFPGHIACSSESRSEIVVPVTKGGDIIGVLDIDSRELNTFDDTDARWRGADSAQLLATVVAEAKAAGWTVGNVDATVICERPKIGPRVADIRRRLAGLLWPDDAEAGLARVSVKGKTNERMDDVGAGLGIEVHAVCLLKAT